MSTYISEELRRQVIKRANSICEYCLVHEDDTFFGCQVDHIISLKHGGPTALDNLAYTCGFCNLHKGSDIGSITRQTRDFIRFFNPRLDEWSTCFKLNGAIIETLDEIGEVTARILRFNDDARILERELLIEAGRYPSMAAFNRIKKQG